MDVDIKEVVSIAKKAGEEILKIYSKDFKVEYKDDKSPLTEADLASNKVINEGLKKIDGTIPILSEENKQIPYSERKCWEMFWLVDPMDGTKEFIKKNGEFTVNIALIKDGFVVLGVVGAPAKGAMYYGSEEGSFKEENGEVVKLEKKEDYRDKERIKVVASRSHFDDDTRKYIENLGKEYELVNVGSSLKFCSVAEGKADIYPRLGPQMEWDIAAGHAVAKFAGRKVYDYKTKEELRYNKKDLLNPWFVVE
ncbi:3'(2'),5'-bisphosphate nucleotidase CysQ [Candidatus Woesearchaeota archaeon]|nr:3'(2'),5'-bisphosphate nucleotidase CysQ [Candidatus Woesearchaeota archaeon]